MTSIKESEPIFKKERIKFDPPEPIKAMTVCNNQITMGLQSNTIIRINLNKSSLTDEIELSRDPSERIETIFTDPSGHHSIIVLSSSVSLYLPINSRKARLFSKLKLQKGEKITAVAWNLHNSTLESSSAILIGTSKGTLVETELLSGDVHKSFEVYSKQVHSFSDFPQPITGLLLDRLPGSDAKTSRRQRYYLIVVVSGRLYQVSAEVSRDIPIYQSLVAQIRGEFKDFRTVDKCSQLSSSCSQGEGGVETRVAWLMNSEVLHGIVASSLSSEEEVITNAKLTPIYAGLETEAKDRPVGMVACRFHFLVLFPNKLNVLCLLDGSLVDTLHYDESYGAMGGIVRDCGKGTVWSYSARAVYKHSIGEESRHVWKVYLTLKQFKLARQYCSDKSLLDDISQQEAEHLFQQGLHEQSAVVWAGSGCSFEEVALRLMRLPCKLPLLRFLTTKFNGMDAKDITQSTMLFIWCVDLWLTQIGCMRSSSEVASKTTLTDANKTTPTDASKPTPTSTDASKTTAEECVQEFKAFLSSAKALNIVKTNQRLLYDLLKNHADYQHLVFIASLIHDYETIILHYIEHGKYASVIDELSTHGIQPGRSMTELTYKYSPTLMQHCAKQTVDFWMQRSASLDPTKLIPAFVQYERARNKVDSQENEVLRYLLYCTNDLCLREQALHNYMLALMAKHHMQDRMLQYLLSQGDDAQLICYDAKYALRLCTEQQLHRACIHLYTVLGLYDEAVELALKCDVELACSVAGRPVGDEDMRRRLWLKVARHAVETEGDIEGTMRVVHGSHLVTIHDVLPFFPEFVTIDKFKDAICSSLKDYNEEIEALKKEMDEASLNTQLFKQHISTFKNRSTSINSDDKCSACDLPLSLRPFYIFPCAHLFHHDCLSSKVWQHLEPKEKQKVKDLRRKLSRQQTTQQQTTQQDCDHLKQQLDDIIASDCIFCGKHMIESIDKPFVEEERLEAVVKSWF